MAGRRLTRRRVSPEPGAVLSFARALAVAVQSKDLDAGARVLIPLLLRPETTTDIQALSGVQRRDIAEALRLNRPDQRVWRYGVKAQETIHFLEPVWRHTRNDRPARMFLNRLTPRGEQLARLAVERVSRHFRGHEHRVPEADLSVSYRAVVAVGRGVLSAVDDRILVALSETAPSVEALGERLHASEATTTRALGRLDAAGLVTTTRSGCAKSISLSPSGQTRLAHVLSELEDIAAMGGTSDELRALRDRYASATRLDVLGKARTIAFRDKQAIKEGRLPSAPGYDEWAAAARGAVSVTTQRRQADP